MKKMKKYFYSGILALCLAVFSPTSSHALILISGSGAFGSFSGSMDYSFTDASTAQMIIKLTNTSPIANGGYLTAFAFNNPSDLITGVTLSATDTDFILLGGTTFDDTIKGSPYGYFDIGSTATGTSWTGGGNPSTGIAVGNMAIFTFGFSGSGLDGLSEQSFLDTLSVKKGEEDEKSANFAVRFRGFEDGGSDKVLIDCKNGSCSPSVPEPASMVLFGTGMIGAIIRKRKLT